MAITLKLINNQLLLSSKRSHNLRGRLKSIKFAAYSSFSGFKVESFNLKSSSSSTINNNVAVSFCYDSSQPPKFTSKAAASDQVKSLNLELSPASTNKDNAVSPFDSIKKALNLLKSKVPALVMASSLMLGMMIFYCHNPALAFPVKRLHSSSLSSSLSSARGCRFCSNGCILCSVKPTRAISAYMSPLEYVLIHGVCACVVAFIWYVVNLQFSKPTSILKIQVGLLDGKDLRRDLSLIEKTLEERTSSAWTTILEDTVEILDWHRDNWILGYSSGKIFPIDFGTYFFRNHLYEERKKFDKDRPVNLRNANTESVTSRIQQIDETKNKFIVVTLLVAFRGRHKFPTIQHQREDLVRVLKKLKSCNSKKILQGVNVLRVPEKEDEIMSLQQLKKNYPLLKPFNPTK